MEKYEISVKEMRWYCPVSEFKFKSTEEIPEPKNLEDVVKGQENAKKMLKRAISLGENAILYGPPGCGKSLLVKQLHEVYSKEVSPDTILYDQLLVCNFEDQNRPIVLVLPTPLGSKFRDDMNKLIKNFAEEVSIFEGKIEEGEIIGQEVITDEKGAFHIRKPIIRKYTDALKELKFQKEFWEKKLSEIKTYKPGMSMRGEDIFYGFPSRFSRIFNEFMNEYIPKEALEMIFERKLQEVNEEIAKIEKKIREKKAKLEKGGLIKKIFEDYKEYSKLTNWLKEAIKNFKEEREKAETQQFDRQDPLEKYKVNLLVDNSHLMKDGKVVGLPFETIPAQPSYQIVVGGAEHDALNITPKHLRVTAGALPKANGGIIKIDELINIIQDHILSNSLLSVWEDKEIEISGGVGWAGGSTSAGIKTQPLKARSISIGLANVDISNLMTEKMAARWPHKIEFDSNMPNTQETRMGTAEFVAYEIKKFNSDPENIKKQLPHFSPEAVATLIEYQALLATSRENKNSRKYLTNIYRPLRDIVKNAGMIAKEEGRKVVEKKHVDEAIKNKRSGAINEQKNFLENIIEGTIIIKTDGEDIGRVNGLVICYDTFGHAEYGIPARVEATTSRGEGGIESLEKELSGKVFHKSFETIKAFLEHRYEQERIAKYKGKVRFDQSYNILEGDSASVATAIAILSSLANVPIRQDIAITGAMSSRGEVQPVGGVNEKIEGFWKLCKLRGLTGTQGVIIPKANVQSLMLNEEIVEDVKERKFHVYAVENIDEVIEIIMNKNPREIDERINKKFDEWKI